MALCIRDYEGFLFNTDAAWPADYFQLFLFLLFFCQVVWKGRNLLFFPNCLLASLICRQTTIHQSYMMWNNKLVQMQILWLFTPSNYFERGQMDKHWVAGEFVAGWCRCQLKWASLHSITGSLDLCYRKDIGTMEKMQSKIYQLTSVLSSSYWQLP